MIRLSRIPVQLRVALVAVSLSLVLLGWAVAGAVQPRPVAASDPDTSLTVAMLGPVTPARTALIERSVASDPFNPQRKAPAVRYKLAHELADVPTGPPARQPLRWVGVVLDSVPANSFLGVALGNNQNAPAEFLKVGGKLGDYTLKSFTRVSATFTHANGDLVVIYNPVKGIR